VVPGKEVNLISLVKTDSLMVNLFIEKLKLTFSQPPEASEDREQRMRENLMREAELKA